jgi:hypothetical protein
MKKLILLLVLLALCAIAVLTAPAIITGVALLFTGTNLVTTAVGLPHVVGVALGLSLLPTTLVLAIKSFSPRFRRLAAVGFLTLAVVYGICAAAIKHKDDLAPVFKSVMAPVEKWEAARHDQRLAELTSENESAKQTLQSQQQQLQKADAALSAEKAARLHDQQVFLDRLSRQLSDGQNGLKLATAKMENPSLQSVVAANQRLAEASNALASAMTNGSLDLPSLQMIVEGAVSNSAEAQLEIQAAAAAAAAKQSALAAAAARSALEEKGRKEAGQSQQLADEQQAQAKIQAAVDAQEKANAVALALAQEKAALEAKAAKLQKLADERQSELAAQNAAAKSQSIQPDPVPVQGNQTPTERRVERRTWAGSGVNTGIRRNFSGGSINIATSNCRWWVLGDDGLTYLVSVNTLCVWIERGQIRSGTLIAREGDPFWGRLTVDYPNY